MTCTKPHLAQHLTRRAALALIAATLSASGLAADPYPSRPITVIVPYPAGGVVDVQTRIVVDRMAKLMGATFIVDNKPGANANIAAEFVARAQPDGHTLLVSAPYLLNNPLFEKGLRWAPKDLDPVARFALSPSYFLVPPSLGVNTLKEYADLARKAPKPLLYANGGTGTTQTMSSETFAVEAGIKLESVPYKGAPPYIPDLINGAVTMAVVPSTVAIPQIKSGRLRALAIVSAHRSALFPELPTIAEAGFPKSTALSWYALHAPAGTPAEAVRKLSAAMEQATAAADVKERLAQAGGEAAYLPNAEFKAFLKEDLEHWQEIIKLLKL
jgi:tripartite-type tricarboxylate transporter receptor subunit TctC